MAVELWQLHCRKQSLELLIAELELSANSEHGLSRETVHATGEKTGERAEHPYLRLRLEYSKRIEQVAFACHRAGVEDRRIQLDAQRADAIAALVRAVVERFLPAPERGEALKFAAGELRQLGSDT